MMNIMWTQADTECYYAWVSAMMFTWQRNAVISAALAASCEMSLFIGSELKAVHGHPICDTQVSDVLIFFEMKFSFLNFSMFLRVFPHPMILRGLSRVGLFVFNFVALEHFRVVSLVMREVDGKLVHLSNLVMLVMLSYENVI